VTPLAFATAGVPGCGGQFKASPEDFEVEELPAYGPTGEGEHLLVWVEKRGRTTPEVARALARHCGLEERQVSWAGLKDRQAVTRQYLCLPAKGAEARLPDFAMPGVTLVRWARHRNKLKSGHLHGNRFKLVLREVRDRGALLEVVRRLEVLGLPNYYGSQRFGAAGTNAERGKALLLAGGRHRDRFERKLWLSAYQSELFNRVASLRVQRGLLGRALLGDVLKKHPTGGEFLCEQPELDQPRLEAFEVSATGPMFGPEMREPAGEPAALEAEVLATEGVGREAFQAGGDETRGARRALRVPLKVGAEVLEGDGTVRLEFELPAGSYATVLLREVFKEDPALRAGGEDGRFAPEEP
jgi:tRNA pseudouridine13 synthase